MKEETYMDNKSFDYFNFDSVLTTISIPISQPNNLNNKELDLSLSCLFKLDLKPIEHVKSSLTYSEVTKLFNDWKFKVEKFKLLIQINHSKNGFAWSDRSILQQNQEFLNKLDFMKHDKSLTSKNITKETKFIKIHQNINQNNNDNNSNINSIEKKNLHDKKYKLKKRSPHNLKSRVKNVVDLNFNLTSFSSFNGFNDCLHSNDDLVTSQITYKPNIISSSDSYSLSSSSSSETNLIKQNGLRFNENKYDSTINMLYNISDVNFSANTSSTIYNNTHINNNINLTELTTIPQEMSISNSSYLNLLNSSFTNSVFFNHNDLNVPQCIVDSTVEEFLNNDLRVGIEASIEHDKFMYF
jgi:hypothetical protein